MMGNELVAKLRAGGKLTDFTQAQLDTISLAAAINLESGSVRILPQKFPKDYLDNGQKQLEYSLHHNGEQLTVSFLGDHRIYQFPSNSGEPVSVEAKSQFLEEIMPSFPKDVDGRGFAVYSAAKSRYESLIFDPYRKVFYRFAFPTITIENEDKLNALRSTPGAFVLIVLDQKGNVLTERKFEGGTYYPSNYFVGEKGLYLSINHPENPKNIEELLKNCKKIYETIKKVYYEKTKTKFNALWRLIIDGQSRCVVYKFDYFDECSTSRQCAAKRYFKNFQ
jgi:hypothetical protein